MTIEARFNKIGPSGIDSSLTYVGYYWLSDAKSPKVLDGESFDFKTLFEDPKRFVVEGNLYNEAKGISYQIKNIDGKPHVFAIDLNGLNIGEDCEEVKVYHAHDIEGFSKYKMYEAWIEQPLYDKGMVDNPDLKSLSTLVPAWAAFIGFKTTKK